MDTIVVGVKNSALFVKKGEMFTGSDYALQFEGIAEGATVLFRMYYNNDVIRNAICVAESVDNGDGTHTLSLKNPLWAKVFEAESYAETMHLKGYLYFVEGDDTSIVASGTVVAKMTPTLGSYDGRPVDVVGPRGEKGDKGDKGDAGADGQDGAQGAKGDDGATPVPTLRSDTTTGNVYIDWVVDGVTTSGVVNVRGAKGDKGDTGATGATGARGAQGDKGEPGLNGAKGDKGDKGDTGDNGYQSAVQAGFNGTEEDYVQLLMSTASLPALKSAIDITANAIASQAETVATAQSNVLENTQKVQTLAGSVDTKINAFNATVGTATETIEEAAEDAVASLGDAVTDAEQARDQAVEAKDEAVASATNASESATTATEAKDATVAIKDELQTALEEVSGVADRVTVVEDVANKALPCALNEFDGWTAKQFNSNVFIYTTIISAPVGFINIYDSSSPSASKIVDWIKPNGDRVALLRRADGDHNTHPWLVYRQRINAGWRDGDNVVFVVVLSGVTYRCTIPFVDGEPNTNGIITETIDGADVSGIALYAVKLSSGFVITSAGVIFDPVTCKRTASLTPLYQRLITSSIEDGVYMVTADGTILVNTDENGAPITTVKNTYKTSSPIASGLLSVKVNSANLNYTNFIGVWGASGSNNNALIESGNLIPAYAQADIGDFIINHWGIWWPTSWGLAASSIPANIPLMRFPDPLVRGRRTDTGIPIAVRSGDSILLLYTGSGVMNAFCPALIIYKETEQ